MDTNDTRSEKSDMPSPARAGWDLFVISLLLLFLELACIRWFPAHVIFLGYFTNTMLMATFLGMSIGCLTTSSKRNYLLWTPVCLALAMAASFQTEAMSEHGVRVDSQAGTQAIYFGTEQFAADPVGGFRLPLEAFMGFFFIMVAVIMIGPGQQLGRALNGVRDRITGYTINILGSIAGIVLFSTCSWAERPPLFWFSLLGLMLSYFLLPRLNLQSVVLGVSAAAIIGLSARDDGDYVPPYAFCAAHYWSPYQRVDYFHAMRDIRVNLIGHQTMQSTEENSLAYSLPHILRRDARSVTGSGQPTPFKNVLIIGAGSGNDVARALQWGATHVDAVEIDPVIQRLGKALHPNHPYDDPRVTVHLNDGRNFLRSAPDGQYDLVIYALIDSLILHSGYSNIRLENYLFTDEAFADVRRCLKPDGQFVMYNWFRQGWLIDRLHTSVEKKFGNEPLVMTLPSVKEVSPDDSVGSFTVFIAGATEALKPLQDAFKQHPEYRMSTTIPPSPKSPNGFQSSEGQSVLGLTKVNRSASALETPSDDWPFLYLRERLIPSLTWRGMAVMGGLALLMFLLFVPRSDERARGRLLDWRMFFLGAGFMLIETKAVVHMALLFGSTWFVNAVVFFAILVMILAANVFALRFRPQSLKPYYIGLFVTLLINGLVPLNALLGWPWWILVSGSCLLVSAPILFAGIIFAVAFGRNSAPDRAIGSNIAGCMVGGFAENASMLLGFRYLVLVALGFYVLSAFGREQAEPAAR